MVDVRSLRATGITPHVEDIARLRVQVFREYPYRYEGDAAYERDYLAHYAESDGAVVVLALEGQRVVGASTGLPMPDADKAFRRPFEDAGIAPEDVFYFGESVLLPAYRGRGIGHRFFDERERHAATLGFPVTAFCAVDRDAADPRRPPDYRPLDGFWRRRGYRRRPDLRATFEWKEIGETEASRHELTFWLRRA